MGGADQWGNITAGLELIRRVERAGRRTARDLAHGLSYPLLLDPTGKKFGKTAAGTSVWLDPDRTSPYAFYQFWLDRDDAEIGRLLRMFTMRDQGRDRGPRGDGGRPQPEARLGQRLLAERPDRTGPRRGGPRAGRGRQRGGLRPDACRQLGPDVARVRLRAAAQRDVSEPRRWRGGPVGLAVAAGLFGSNGEARRTISQGGLSINEVRVASVDDALPALLPGGYLILRSGKKAYLIVASRRAS